MTKAQDQAKLIQALSELVELQKELLAKYRPNEEATPPAKAEETSIPAFNKTERWLS